MRHVVIDKCVNNNTDIFGRYKRASVIFIQASVCSRRNFASGGRLIKRKVCLRRESVSTL